MSPCPLCRLYQASGDIRANGDQYIYDIQLSGITNSSSSKCLGANICQVKINGDHRRKIGFSSMAKYYVKGKRHTCQTQVYSKVVWAFG